MTSPRQIAPALVTMLALGCGLASIEAVRVGNFDLALRLILLAAVADGVDGRLARHLRATSDIGEQFDSLSDIIAFGVAPAFLFVSYFAGFPDVLRYGVGFAFVIAGVYRLARFNAEPSTGSFTGLPITAGGPLLAVGVAGPFDLGIWGAAIVAIALGILMVCNLPFPKLAKPRSRRVTLALVAGVALPIMLWPRVETVAIMAAVILVAYVAAAIIAKVVQDEIVDLGVEEVHDAREQAH